MLATTTTVTVREGGNTLSREMDSRQSRQRVPDRVKSRWGRHLGPRNVHSFRGLSHSGVSATLLRCHAVATAFVVRLESGDQLRAGVGREVSVTHRHVDRGVVGPSLDLAQRNSGARELRGERVPQVVPAYPA